MDDSIEPITDEAKDPLLGQTAVQAAR